MKNSGCSKMDPNFRVYKLERKIFSECDRVIFYNFINIHFVCKPHVVVSEMLIRERGKNTTQILFNRKIDLYFICQN